MLGCHRLTRVGTSKSPGWGSLRLLRVAASFEKKRAAAVSERPVTSLLPVGIFRGGIWTWHTYKQLGNAWHFLFLTGNPERLDDACSPAVPAARR